MAVLRTHCPRRWLALAPSALLLAGCIPLLEGRHVIDNLHVSPGRGFSVQADLFCEVTCGISYRTWDPAHGATPAQLLGFASVDPSELEFSLRVSPGDRWVGLADKLQPQIILALHDFDTGFD